VLESLSSSNNLPEVGDFSLQRISARTLFPLPLPPMIAVSEFFSAVNEKPSIRLIFPGKE